MFLELFSCVSMEAEAERLKPTILPPPLGDRVAIVHEWDHGSTGPYHPNEVYIDQAALGNVRVVLTVKGSI